MYIAFARQRSPAIDRPPPPPPPRFAFRGTATDAIDADDAILQGLSNRHRLPACSVGSRGSTHNALCEPVVPHSLKA